jgi:filamentous hemagglutinin family protein
MKSSLNHIFRTIWSDALGTWIVVSEISKAKTKRSACGASRARREECVDSRLLGIQINKLRPVIIALACACGLNVQANPIGGTVVNGQASFATSGSTLTVTNTPGTIINWQGFSINANEATRFAQQSAASTVLNRVTGANPSNILGSLQSNGRVFLVNPNGIVFGAGSTIDVAGMVASTLNLSNADFLAGRHNYTAVPGAQNISNAGNIKAQDGGQIYLIAPNVENSGIITAPNGEVLLAAGNSVELVNTTNPNLRVSITAPAGNATNVGQLVANSGSLGLFGTLVKNTGTLSANSATLQGGKIVLKAMQQVDAGGNISAQGSGGGNISVLADMQNGTVNVTGKLDASAPNAGNGGFIETSAAHVSIANSASVTTAATQGLAGTWLIDPVDFTIAATGGDLTGTALSTSLGAGNVNIQSSTGASGSAGNINVNDTVTWSASTLTLNASNNININTTMNGSGTASLALQYGQGAVALNNTGTYNLNNAAQVNLPAGAHFSTKLGSDGATSNYTVITTLGAAGSVTTTDLQGMNGNLAGNYVLGANIDATLSSGWNTAAGFAPIGAGVNFSSYTPYSGTFDGLGHTITSLTIARSTTPYIGLFGIISASSAIRNIGLIGGTVSGASYTGDLVGVMLFGGTLKNSYATGNVSGTTNVGGLVGNNWFGTISNSYATGTVTGTGNYVGGLVGDNNFGTISNSYATGNLTSAASSYSGGLVGYNNGTISNAYATGSITGGTVNFIGGLTGLNSSTSTISNSFWDTTTSLQTIGIGGVGAAQTGASGLTTANLHTQTNFTSAAWDFTNTWLMYNGLTNPLLRSFLTPLTVTASNTTLTYTGVAQTGSAVTYSVAPNANLLGTTSFTGGTNVGSYTITPSNLYSNQQGYLITYTTGTLTINPAALTVTGLTGTNRTYNGSTVDTLTGTAALSGLMGTENLTLGNAASGTLASANVGTQAVSTAITISNGTGLASNYTLTQPTLSAIISQAPLTVSVTSVANKSYDGTTTATLSGGILSGIIGTDTVTLSQAGTFATQNVGTAIAVTGADSLGGISAGNYVLTQPAGLSANITQAPLSVTGLSGNRTYNGSTVIALSGTAALSGLAGTETLTLGGTASGTLASANAGTQAITTAITIANGTGLAGNYALTQPTLSASIAQAPLTVTGLSATGRTYNGSTAIGLTGTATLAGLLGVETLTPGNTSIGTLASANAGTQSVNTAITISNGSGLAGNYALTQPTTLSAIISQAPLTITGTSLANNKTYNGTTSATLSGGSLSGIIGSDSVTLTQTGTFASQNVGTGISVTAADTLGGAASGNYAIVSQPTGLSANITPAPLTATIIGTPTKVYDGNATATLTSANYSLSGLFNSDGATLTQYSGTYNSANVVSANTVSSTLTSANFTATGSTLLSNYTLPTTASGTAKITPAPLTATVAAPNKVYDGTTTATPTLSITGGFIGTETVSASGTAIFNSANVATANLVTVNSTTLSNGTNGGLAGNYSLATGETVSANITPAVLNVTANAASKYAGSQDPALTYTTAGLQHTDTQANTLSGTLIRSMGETTGTYLINAGTLAMTTANYSLSYSSANFIIIPSNALNSLANVVAALPTTLTINMPSAAPVVTTASVDGARVTASSSSAPDTNASSASNTDAQAQQKEEKKEEAGKVAATNKTPTKTSDAPTAKPLPVCN